MLGDQPAFREPAEGGLQHLIGNNPARMRVKRIVFWQYSRIKTAWPIGLFPFVESVDIKSESMMSFSEISGARHLRDLALDLRKRKGNLDFLRDCPLESLRLFLTDPADKRQISVGRTGLRSLALKGKLGADLRGLEPVGCESVEILRADCESLAGLSMAQTRSISLCFCPRLANLGPLGQTRSLEIMACGAIRLEDIRDAPALEHILVRSSPRAIKDFSFVRNLPSLRSLSIGRVRIETSNLEPLIACRTLRKLLLVQAPRDCLAKLAAARPDLMFLGGRTGLWRNGIEIPKILR